MSFLYGGVLNRMCHIHKRVIALKHLGMASGAGYSLIYSKTLFNSSKSKVAVTARGFYLELPRL